MDLDDGAPGVHAAFEVFWTDLDAGILSRDEATAGLEAIMSIVASPDGAPSLPNGSDMAILGNAARDEVLVAMAPWLGQAFTRPGSQDGWIGRLSVDLGELAGLTHEYRHQIAVAGLSDPAVLVGHFLLVCTARGDVVVREFATSVTLADAYANTCAIWTHESAGPVL